MRRKRRWARGLALAVVFVGITGMGAAAQVTGSVSGLPVPRYVSLKADKVNVRGGPSRDHDVAWVFTRAGIPVEITAESENWRRIRDAEGDQGWVYHSLLSGRRTALVAPHGGQEWFALRARPDAQAQLMARVEARVQATIHACDGSWCRVSGRDFDGYMEQHLLWGVYPNEKFD